MFKKLIFLVSFVFVLSTGITAQATPIPVSVNPAVETVVGEDGNVFPDQSYSTFLLQVSDHIDGITQGRRVTLISYDISGLKNNDKQRYRSMSLSVLGFIPGNVDVYGVVEDQDNISGGLKWNNAPGVNNAQKVGYSVELDMDDLTDKLFSFTAPKRDERKSIGACQALDDFINSDTDGVVTFLLAPSKGSKFVKMWSSTYPGGGIVLNGEMTLGIDIAWVTETVDRDEDGVQDDQVWIDWLVAEGYDLNLQPDRYLTLGDDKDPNDTNDYVGELNLADLVIISRTASSGGYASDDNEVAAWASVTSPMISVSAWHVRSNRLKWILSTTVNRTLDTYMLALETDHPVLNGVALEDNLVEMVFTEGFADGYQGNCVIGDTDVGNGTLIGQSFSDETMIAEWPAGKEAYDGAGVVQAGPRLLFCAGTENASTTANLLPQGDWNLTDAGEMMFRNSIEYMLSLPPAGAKVVFVTSVKDNDADGVQDDISWVEWLKARGYNVDFRPGNWIDPLDEDKIAELEAADVIIASRGMATGEYDGDETAKWNGISTPIICINAWMIRSSRWVWMNSTSANKDAGAPILMALDTKHPIFDGVELDQDGLVEILDPDIGSGHTSFLTDILDVGNGSLLAQSLGIYNTAWVVEWPAGVEYYEGAGQIASGRRMLFMAGTQDDPYTDANGNIMPVGVLNLNDAGKKMFHNTIKYMLTPPPPTVIYVTSVKDQNIDEVQDNVSWVDWLEAEGYKVDFRPDNWVEPLDDDKIAELEAADLIIASRGMSTGSYDDDTTTWNSLSTPMICTNAWMIRSNRWVWMNSTSANKDAGAPILMALETEHPIFAGVELDQDGLVEILGPEVGSGHTSFLTDILDVGNGSLLAQSLGIYNTAWVVEWPAGVEYYAGAGQTTGGPRILFMAGTQDDPYTDANGNITPVDVLNLNDAGKQMFLNAMEYLL